MTTRTADRHAGFRRGLVVVLAAVAVVLAGPVPARATPSPSDVEAQIDREWNALEPVIEQYNHVHGQLRANRTRVKGLAATLRPLQRRVDAAMAEVGGMAADAYMQGRPAAGAMLLTGSSTDFVDKLTFLNELARHRRDAVSDVTRLRDAYAAQKRDLDTATAALATRDADLAVRKKAIEAKIADLQKLRLAVYDDAGGELRTGACPVPYTRDPGGLAAKKACSLIGKPYIWAAAGPSGYDCSGLTLTAWGSVGVLLPHYTRAQWGATTPVSRDELRPGDLVFYYGDLHHVGIYVGADTIVHAPRTGDRVRMAPIDRSPPAGFRRPG